jgi:hypothetical protein
MASTPQTAPLDGLVHVRPDVVEFAVVPSVTVRLLQVQQPDVVAGGEVVHVAPVLADLLEQCVPSRVSRVRPGCAQRPVATTAPTSSWRVGSWRGSDGGR